MINYLKYIQAIQYPPPQKKKNMKGMPIEKGGGKKEKNRYFAKFLLIFKQKNINI